MTVKKTDAEKKAGYPVKLVKDGESHPVGEGVCIISVPVALVLPEDEMPTGELSQPTKGE